ncbi:MAG: rhomboid family intramembrane serine protease [Pirellulaceae bacterium]|nr:rhomboid family intramembrane serine protease [Pirellulaceae bacterium]
MRKDFYFVGIFILVIWLVYIVDAFIPYAINSWGVQPRTVSGLIGIPLMPLLHGGFYHVFSNTISLVILMALLVGSQRQHWPIVVAIVIVNGVLVWLMGRSDSNHVGASGLIFGLIGFLILNGFLAKKPLSIGIALLVGFLFGGTLISGVIPRIGSQVSWEGHLFGVIAGAAVAYFLAQKNKRIAWR